MCLKKKKEKKEMGENKTLYRRAGSFALIFDKLQGVRGGARSQVRIHSRVQVRKHL